MEGARRSIAARFVDHCNFAEHSVNLQSHGAAACGQFLSHRDAQQRGIHGTAAALRVLAGTPSEDAIDLCKRIVVYLNRRAQIESLGMLPDERRRLRTKIEEDDNNVIKVSETLYALSFVPAGVASTEALVQRLAGKLQLGMLRNKGWDYFLDIKSEPQPLPSAFALRALAHHGLASTNATDYLLEQIDSEVNGTTDLAVQTLCLYVLTTLPGRSSVDLALPTMARCFDRLWSRLSSLMSLDLETNAIYQRGNDHLFVGVPWQLYLLAVASLLRPYRVYASAAAQGRLVAVVHACTGETGFVYPFSENRSASRTNAILYDVLKQIETQSRKYPLLDVFHGVDRGRAVLSGPAFSYAAIAAGAAFAGFATLRWARSPGTSISELGPHFLAAGVIALLGLRKGIRS